MLKPLPRTTSHPRPPAAPVDGPEMPALAPIGAPRPMQVLDFDIENRPLSYWYDGKCTAEITAIAWQMLGADPVPRCYPVTHDRPLDGPRMSSIEMLYEFKKAYDTADMVTGHYIRRHDLPIIQAALIEHGLPLLGPKLTSDTRLDLVKFQDLAKSQAALGAMLGLQSPKESMSQTDWRDANRLTASGVEQTMRRVIGDVRQHVELRQALLDGGLLGPPRMWNPR